MSSFVTATPSGSCNTAFTVVLLRNGNHSVFYDDTIKYLQAHPGPQATNWRPILQRIQNGIILSRSTTAPQKIKPIAQQIKTYIGNSSLRASYLNPIQLAQWGTYFQLVKCGGNLSLEHVFLTNL
ncbi:hypothetical protein QR680_015678 [Steinernema hermaphroditum]|uniref:Uncharacterized protein n=1 Tax=Steinernema hermaphroditum TaxID=289476 RepID=A0AA39H8M2_9BILA|nr:hypothetical protein QR680_015678 [Steinernema hermaphroditum]